MKTLLAFFCITFALVSFSASVTHGPIVGAVTDVSCRVFVRTDSAVSVTVELSPTSTFLSIVSTATGTTDSARNNIATFALNGLQPNTKYFVHFLINGNISGDVGTFETFHSTSSSAHQVFLTGSSIKDLTSADSSIFTQAKTENAKGFIEMGNWGYPDGNGWFDIYFSSPPQSWANTYTNVQDLYKQRYTSLIHQTFIKSIAMDYVYSDHDFLNDAAAKDAVSGIVINPFLGLPLGQAELWTQLPVGRNNSMQGYRDWFPAYPLYDSTEGIYHSFRSGNAEFFVIDTRSMRQPQALAIAYSSVTTLWSYAPASNYTMLGTNQMNWLKNGLQNSTAKWKFIISTDTYNRGGRLAYDTLLKIGNGAAPYWELETVGITIANKGYTAVQYFADMWAGFHEDADSLLFYVLDNNIKNVFMISGNSNTVGLDDGINSGLPELNSGNLKQTNSYSWKYYQQFMGFNEWDLGGSGLCGQDNFNPTYGRIEIFNDDSIRLSAVDANGNEVCGANFFADAPYKYNPLYHANRLPVAANDVATVANNDTVNIAVLTNDSDFENDPLYVGVVTNPVNGTVVTNPDNSFTYTPDSAFTGTDTFSYQTCESSNALCANCVTARVTITVTQATAIQNLPANVQVKVYPNPTQNTLFVEASNSDEVFQIELTTTLGEKLLSKKFTSKTSLDVSQLASGSYFYSLKRNKEVVKHGKIEVLR